MSEQIGWRGLIEKFKAEAPRYSHIFPQLPRLAHQALQRQAEGDQHSAVLTALLVEQRATNRLLRTIVYFGAGLLAGVLAAFYFLNFAYVM